jgi:FG-GAP repeat protein
MHCAWSSNRPLTLSALFGLAIVSLISTRPSLAHTFTKARAPTEIHAPAEIAKLIPINTESHSSLGQFVAISGNTAIASTVRGGKGAAYVFGRHSRRWVHEATLIPNDGASLPATVAISGDTAVLGSSGAAYVFRRLRGAWTQEAKLTATDAAERSRFGASVALDGRTAVIGAPDSDGGQGAVYVFVRVGGVWLKQAKLTARVSSRTSRFGFSVAVSDDTALVGAPGAFALYVFVRNGDAWTEQQKIDGPPSVFGFGEHVALDADTALSSDGLRTESCRGTPSAAGIVHVYTRTGSDWASRGILRASDEEGADIFGSSVAVAGDIALVGAPGDDGSSACSSTVGDIASGSVYVLTRSNGAWTQHAKITASDETRGAHFGESVALDVGTAVIGAPDHDGKGSAYIFSLVPVLFDLLRQSFIGQGRENSLSDKVELAQVYHASGDKTATCEVLSTFMGDVAAQAAKKLFTDAKAMELLDKAVVISTELRCHRAD